MPFTKVAFPFPDAQGASPGFIAMASATARSAFIFRAQETGPLSAVTISQNSAGGSAHRVRVETVSAGLPSGTLATAGAEATYTANVALTPQEITFGTPASVTAGTLYAIVISVDTYVASSPIQGISGNNHPTRVIGEPYSVSATTGAFTRHANQMAIALKINGSYVYTPRTNVGLFATTGQTSASNPDEFGIKVTWPDDAVVFAFWINGPNINATGLTIRIYDSSSNVLQTWTNDIAFTATEYSIIQLPAPLEVSSGSVNRITLLPGSGSMTLRQVTIPSTDYTPTLSGGADVVGTTRTDAGTWTDNALIRPQIGFVLREAGGAGGGGGTPTRYAMTAGGLVAIG